MNKIIVCILVGFGVLLVVTSSSAKKIDGKFESESTPEKSTGSLSLSSIIRQKRGYGHGGGGGSGGGGHGGGSYGHGPGAGGGARGPVYFCGWVGSKMGSGGYGGYGK